MPEPTTNSAAPAETPRDRLARIKAIRDSYQGDPHQWTLALKDDADVSWLLWIAEEAHKFLEASEEFKCSRCGIWPGETIGQCETCDEFASAHLMLWAAFKWDSLGTELNPEKESGCQKHRENS